MAALLTAAALIGALPAGVSVTLAANGLSNTTVAPALGAPGYYPPVDLSATALDGDTLAAGSSEDVAPDMTSWGWQPAGVPPAMAAAGSLTVLTDGRVLSVEGMGMCNDDVGPSIGGYRSAVYDPGSNTWRKAGRTAGVNFAFHVDPLASLKHASALFVGAKYPSSGPARPAAAMFKLSTLSWTPVRGPSTVTEEATVARSTGGQVLLFGGSMDSTYSSDIEVYKPASRTWRSAGTMSEALTWRGVPSLSA